jgi:hypothetical protein
MPTFAIVFARNYHEFYACILVLLGHLWNRANIARQGVGDRIDLPCVGVRRPDQSVVRDVLQMAAVFQPGAGLGDVIGCAFALDLRLSASVSAMYAP